MPVYPLQEIKKREEVLIDLLASATPQGDISLPLPAKRVLEALNQLDSPGIIAQYKEELTRIVEDIKQEPGKFEAMKFTWFYDGGDIPDNATGNAYETCQVNYDFLFSDRKKGSLEREKSAFDGSTLYLGYLSIDKVMSVWYEDLIKNFQDLDNDVFIEDPRNGETYELLYVYAELFELKLFKLLAQAYEQIKVEKPSYFFMQRHDRWPVLIADDTTLKN